MTAHDVPGVIALLLVLTWLAVKTVRRMTHLGVCAVEVWTAFAAAWFPVLMTGLSFMTEPARDPWSDAFGLAMSGLFFGPPAVITLANVLRWRFNRPSFDVQRQGVSAGAR